MPKQGFNNQWIAISLKGKFKDSKGVERNLDEDFLNKVIANFQANNSPAVVGHPKDNTPAFGWASALRLNDGVLEAQFADTDDQFEQMVAEGKFRKRSASFYLDPPSLKHVGFLGAMPPAVKGLRDIQFSDGESVTVEISFNEEQKMEDQEMDKVAESLWDKIKAKFSTEAKSADNSAANFTEADAKKLIDEAVAKAKEDAKKEAVAEFAEQMKERDTKIENLTASINAQTASGKRADINSFVESIPAEKGKHFLKRAGIAEFMESLAIADEAQTEVAISFSEGDGDSKVEHKFSRLDWFKNFINDQKGLIEFGEKFGSMKVTDQVTEFVDPERSKIINAELGLDGGEK